MSAPDYHGWERREMLRFVPQTARRILDVGCAKGRFGALVKRHLVAEVWGIEPDPGAAAVAQGRLDRVLVADVATALPQLPAAGFDCVVCNDVLEHLVDPWQVLGLLKGLLAPDGVLVASIPNVRHYPVLRDLVWRGEWTYQDEGVLDRTHLRFFTRSGIQRLFTDGGWVVRRLEGINATTLGHALSLVLPRAVADLPFQQFACVATPG